MNSRTRAARTLAVLASLSFVAAACGSDDDSSTTSPTTPVTAGVTTPEATTPGTSADTAPGTSPETTPAEPGEPIKIMAFGTFESQSLNLDQARAGVEAHVKVLNAEGGVAGHEIEVIVCNDNFDPNEAAACARQAVDEGVVAVVGPASGYASAALPILEEAKIPYLNGSGAGGVIELTSPDSFPLHGGSQVQLMGAGRVLVDQGAKNVTIIVADADQAREAAKNIEKAIELGGGTPSTVIAPIGAPDYSAVAASALDNDPEGIVIAHVPADAPKIVQALRQAGYEGAIATSTGILTQTGIDSIGEAAEGVLLLDRGQLSADTSIPEVKAFNDAMKDSEPDAKIDPASLNGWAAVTFFAALVERTDGEITGAALIDTIHSLDTPIETGIFPPYSGPTDTPPVADFPQVVSFQANLAIVKDGKVVSNGGFIDPLAAP